MSNDEEKAIIGGLVLEYGEVKRRIVALELEVGRIGSIFEWLSRAFLQPALMVQHHDEFEKNLSDMPERKVVLDLIEEHRAKLRRRSELQKLTKQYGLEI